MGERGGRTRGVEPEKMAAVSAASPVMTRASAPKRYEIDVAGVAKLISQVKVCVEGRQPTSVGVDPLRGLGTTDFRIPRVFRVGDFQPLVFLHTDLLR